MLNYVALAWVQFWVFGPWSEGGFQQTATFPKERGSPAHRLRQDVPAVLGLTTHLGMVFALIATAIVLFAVSRTRGATRCAHR
jgi:simple sugar transport system permease protein